MATKILITPKNSIWGVIVNPQSSNTYRHALSFDTPALKKAFIDKELCEGKDYKALLAAQKETSFTRMTPTSGVFTIHPDQYPDETFFTLLNKDFCIIEEDGVEQFYTLTATRDPDGGNTIVFTAELDIFFTYDIKDGMFNDQETEIKRGMFDRFTKNPSGDIEYLDNYLNTPLVNKESFDSDFTNLRFPFSTGEKIIHEGTHINWTFKYISIVADDLTPDQELEIKKFVMEIKWQIISIMTKPEKSIPGMVTPNFFSGVSDTNKNITQLYSSKNTSQSINLPYVNFVTPALNSDNTGNNVKLSFLTETIPFLLSLDPVSAAANYDGFSFDKKLIENTSVLKNSLQVLAVSPLSMLDGVNIDVVLTASPVIPEFNSLSVKITIPDSTSNGEIFNIDSTWNRAAAIGIKRVFNNNRTIKMREKINPTQIDLSILNERNIELEPKLNFSPYTVFQLGSSTKTKSSLLPENFTKNEIELKLNGSYLTTNWGYQIDLQNYGNINSLANPFLESNRNFIHEDFANYGIPTDQDQWQEFMTRNRSQQNASFLNKGVGLGIGVLGAIAAPFTGGASLGIATLGLGSVAAKSAAEVNSQIAQRKDIKNTPNTIENNGTTFGFDWITKSFTPYIQRMTLEPLLRNQIYDHIYKYGYNFDSKLNKINKYLNSRYWFNYIEASKTYENVALQASDQIKQLINDTLENGLTIWHVRDLNTFKGIKNYENENVEMSLITTVNDEEVINDNREEE